MRYLFTFEMTEKLFKSFSVYLTNYHIPGKYSNIGGLDMYFLNFVLNRDNVILKCLNYDNNGVKKKKNGIIHNEYNNKLLNNITRAKSNILDYAYNNDFKYFLTATFSSKYDRTDLNKFMRLFSQIVRDCRKKYGGDFFYLVVPELHKDLKHWHLHGLIGGSCVLNDIYVNKYGYYSLHCLDNLGFNSLSVIQNKEACNIYVTKYITKGIVISRRKGDHIFYRSHGLEKGYKYAPIKISESLVQDISFDFSNDRIKVKKFFDIDSIVNMLANSGAGRYKHFIVDNLKKIE